MRVDVRGDEGSPAQVARRAGALVDKWCAHYAPKKKPAPPPPPPPLRPPTTAAASERSSKAAPSTAPATDVFLRAAAAALRKPTAYRRPSGDLACLS